MEFFLSLSNNWKIIYKGVLKIIFELFTYTPLQLVRVVFGENEVSDVIYALVEEILSIVPIGETTLANMSFFSMMFGVGIGFLIVYSFAKWLKIDVF